MAPARRSRKSAPRSETSRSTILNSSASSPRSCWPVVELLFLASHASKDQLDSESQIFSVCFHTAAHRMARPEHHLLRISLLRSRPALRTALPVVRLGRG